MIQHRFPSLTELTVYNGAEVAFFQNSGELHTLVILGVSTIADLQVITKLKRVKKLDCCVSSMTSVVPLLNMETLQTLLVHKIAINN